MSASAPQLTVATGTCSGMSARWGEEGRTGAGRTEQQDVASPRAGSELAWSHDSSCPLRPRQPLS